MAYGTVVGGSIAAATKIPSSWVTACGQAAPLVSSGVFLSPLPTVQNIIRDKSVGNLPLLPYSSMCVNSFMWMTYGILKKDAKFQKYCPKNASNLPGTLSQHIQVSTALVTAALLVTMALGAKGAAPLIGKLGVVLCVILFASPLAALKTVIQTKSAKSIPLPFTLTCILNCFLWTVYGFDMGDFNIYFPNLLGLLSSLAQFALILVYGSGKGPQLPI